MVMFHTCSQSMRRDWYSVETHLNSGGEVVKLLAIAFIFCESICTDEGRAKYHTENINIIINQSRK